MNVKSFMINDIHDSAYITVHKDVFFKYGEDEYQYMTTCGKEWRWKLPKKPNEPCCK